MKKVSADTITDLTTASGFSAGPPLTPPDSQKMIEDIRSALALRVETLARHVERSKTTAPDPSGLPTPFEISYQRAVQAVQEFEKIISTVPDGFRLMPVLYSKVRQEENAKVEQEYKTRVRPHFMHYLAEHHAIELKALGICQRGIDQMKKGLYPVDPSGKLYTVNIDHIIERSGGGTLSQQKSIDPLMPPGSAPTFAVNHFSNLMLLPVQVHDNKNKLNTLQSPAQIKAGQSKWMLMLIPEITPHQAGFVAAPQKPQHPLYGLRVHPENMQNLIRHTDYMVKRVHEALEAGADQEDAFLKPAIEDLSQRLQIAFNEAARPDQKSGNYKTFVGFYRSRGIAALRRKTKGLPFDEAARLHETLQAIDRSIQIPFNDNTAPRKNRHERKRGHKKHRQPKL